MLNQTFFEMTDIPALSGRAWIPLRQNTEEDLDPIPGVTTARRYTGVATLAVFGHQQTAAERLDWSELDLSPHRAYGGSEGYHPADVFQDFRSDEFLGLNLVIDQTFEGAATDVWHLHPDLVVALGLVREGDAWFRPDEGWIEVARLIRDDEQPVKVEIRAEHLADYLAARDMKLYASSFHERVAETEIEPAFSWGEDGHQLEEGRDQRQGQIAPLRDLGESGGGYRVAGALWRTEWLELRAFSPRVRGDKDPSPIDFAVGPLGERRTPLGLQQGIDWLYFGPALVNHLMKYRGGELHWSSGETGGVGAAEAALHFGVNAKGLITVFAKDIARLQPWEQRVWSAHSVPADGEVSKELFQAQMMCEPAATIAPEARLAQTIQTLEATFERRFGEPLLRANTGVAALLSRIHRFRAAEADGLLILAKDLTRLFIERVDVAAVHRAALACGKSLKKDLKALKALEGLASVQLGDECARTLMAPLFGIYDLRIADAHLSSEPPGGLERVGVDPQQPVAMQGRAMLDHVADALAGLAAALEPAPSSAPAMSS